MGVCHRYVAIKEMVLKSICAVIKTASSVLP